MCHQPSLYSSATTGVWWRPRGNENNAVRTGPNLSNSRKKSSTSVSDSRQPSERADADLSMPAADRASDIVDAIIEIGTQRRQILLKMKAAVLANDKDAVFNCAAELVGLHNETPKAER
jgi:hypothetical protein